VLAAVALLLAACSGPGADSASRVAGKATPSSSPPSSPAVAVTPADAAAPLRPGEQFRTLTVPGGPYLPAAPSGGHDDYHCFLLDPQLATDRYVTGSDVLPGNPAVVHHAILFTVPPDQVADAEAHDAQTAGRGWTCFGGIALPNRTTTALSALDSAPWLAAWAPGGGESVFGRGTGKLLAKGSRVILQVHYNLREGSSPDSTAVRLRLAPAGAHLKALKTMLLVAPVELPCPPEETGLLCDRSRAITDLTVRFGPNSGRTVAGLQLLCGGSFINPRAGNTQHCDRRVGQDMTVRAVAGHMHLLGRSISVTLDPGGPRERTLLDRPVWDFDNQGATPLKRAARVRAGDTLRVTCTHDPTLRNMLPELEDEQPRYVTWGEGTSDEMCLGIVMYTDA
jgi:Copper type II ascorbate-dependent monooxygenase, C-terminal domain